MYNNDVTYADKWDTPENQAALAKLEKKFFDKSECSPSCPVAWAPEVLEMMETLERELGFRYNEGTMRGYYIQGTPLDWFVKNPWSGFFSAFMTNVFGYKPFEYKHKPGTTKRVKIKRTLYNRVKSIINGFTDPIGYGFRALIIKYVNPIRNRFEKRRISLGQLKEKYGSLTCYFHAPDAFEEFIDKEIGKCKIKLALKGAYYPIETLWDSAVSYDIENDYEPDSIAVTYGEYKGERTVSVKKTTYRKLMKELGLNLKEIQEKADLRAASKADPK